ncbi:MAG: cytochrome c [Burkholderiales bacterium]|nr:cytochrome c [Burkholderiales bacterium]MDE2398923.1 cytochrome c [Burkholderiales bacterium]
MHHAASPFSIAAADGSATGDIEPVLAALAKLNATCVACHAAYRLQ